MQTLSQSWREITINGYITADLPGGAQLATPTGIKSSGEVCRARALLEQIEAARGARTRAMVVTVDSVGGDMEASLAVYRALRRYSAEGGTVLVLITGMAASSASVIALAGDVVLMAADARFLVHSAVSPDARAKAKANADMLAAYLERTTTPPEELVEWLAYQHDPVADLYNCAELKAEAAVAYGWADATGTAVAVRDLAGAVASGAYCSTPRRLALASGGAADAAIVTYHLAAKAVSVDKLTVGNFDNLVPNPTCMITTAPAGTPEGAGLYNYGSGFSPNGWYRKLTFSGASTNLPVTGLIPAAEGDQYYFSARGFFGNVIRTNTVRAVIRVADAAGNAIAWGLSPYLTTGTAATGETLGASVTCPAGTASIVARLDYDAGGGAVAGDYALFSNFYLRRKADASVIVDGSLKTSDYSNGGTLNTPSEYATSGAKLQTGGTGSGYSLLAVPEAVKFGQTTFGNLWSWGTKKLALGTTPTADALYAYYLLTGAAESNSLLRGCVTNGAQIGRFKITAPGNYLVSYRAQVSRTTATNGHVLASVYRIRGNTLVQQTYIFCTGTNYHTASDQALILAADTVANDEYELCLTGYSATAQGQFQFTIQRLPD